MCIGLDRKIKERREQIENPKTRGWIVHFKVLSKLMK